MLWSCLRPLGDAHAEFQKNSLPQRWSWWRVGGVCLCVYIMINTIMNNSIEQYIMIRSNSIEDEIMINTIMSNSIEQYIMINTIMSNSIEQYIMIMSNSTEQYMT